MSNSSDPMDCSLPDSSVHGIFQAKVLEWGATAFSDGKRYGGSWKNDKKKKKNRITMWSSNPTPGILSGQNYNSKRYMHPMFILVLFIITKTWRQLKCPLTDEWLKKMWYKYIMEYYSVIKKKNLLVILQSTLHIQSSISSHKSCSMFFKKKCM